MTPKTSSRSLDVDAVDPKTLREEYLKLAALAEKLEAQLAARELELAKRNADVETQEELGRLLRQELEATTADLEYLESQFISLEHRLTRAETRASAAASIADAQLLFEKFRKDASSVISPANERDVERKIAAAEDQMTRNNYAAAAYYANRAIRLLNQSERRRNAFFAEGGARIVAVESANVREGPGAGFNVIGQLKYGTILVELEKKDDWMLVKTRDGLRGWVHGTLLH